MKSTYAEVIVPIPLRGSFTYQIPEELWQEQLIGCRVVVPFGSKKKHTGILVSVHDQKPSAYEPKLILDVLDELPKVNELQLSFFHWMSNYYMCTQGEVVNAALPAALKLSSEAYIGLNGSISNDIAELDEREVLLLQMLSKQDLSMKNAGEILGLKHPYRIIKALSERKYVDLYEKVKDKFQPKKVKKVRLVQAYCNSEALEILVNRLETKPKQQDVILSYLKQLDLLDDFKVNEQGIQKQKLLEETSASSLKTLVKNKVLEEYEEIVSRIEVSRVDLAHDTALSQAQQNSITQINKAFQTFSSVLLHGVTGSGKTEIYTELIKKELKDGKQVLFLLPEIALTTQIITRLAVFFGKSFGVYHSRYSDNERVEVWNKVLDGSYQFVVGVRSAIFLPFKKLSLVVIDEEHESSYKQYDPAPRYHARDAAIYLATLHKAKVLLGTATPSLESYTNSLDGRYGLVELFERYGEAHNPQLYFANILKQRKQKKLKGNFSIELVNEIKSALTRKEQVILFQNRRGYASYVSCDHCAAIPKCPNCAVSLTYHQYNNKLACHYCGFNQPMYTDCISCGHKELRQIGFGTEELEEELEILFPAAIIQRMDLDTTRSKNSYERIISSFEAGEIDILVGTQMVSKGLDFDKVNLVGIFDTDRMIHFPHFRSHERAYQLITQVSGRAGRKSKEGKVIIQTNDPEQELLNTIKSKSYQHFYQQESAERKAFNYPPFVRLINISIKHRDKEVTLQAANFFAKEVRATLGFRRILGPTEPIVGKIRNLYIQEILIKTEKKGVNISRIKEYLWDVKEMTQKMPAYKNVGVVFDVDPN